MSKIGDPVTSTIPPVGTVGTTYATEINDFLEEVKERIEQPITADSIAGATLDLEGNPVINASYVQLFPQTSVSVVGALYETSGELFFESNSGSVQITSLGSLNAGSIGGIGGDYGSPNPALVDFDDGTKTYLFYDDSTTSAFGYVRGLGLEVAGGSTSLVRVRLAWAGASSYTLTLPASLPATQKLLQMDASGNVTASGVLATNEDITISGTGEYKHGAKAIHNTALPYYCSGTITTTLLGGTQVVWQVPASSTTRIPLLGLRQGDSISSVVLRAGLTSGSTQPVTFTLLKQTNSTAATVTTSTAGTFAAAGTTGDITLTVTTPTTIGSSAELYYLNIVCGASGVTLQSTTTTKTRP